MTPEETRTTKMELLPEALIKAIAMIDTAEDTQWILAGIEATYEAVRVASVLTTDQEQRALFFAARNAISAQGIEFVDATRNDNSLTPRAAMAAIQILAVAYAVLPEIEGRGGEHLHEAIHQRGQSCKKSPS